MHIAYSVFDQTKQNQALKPADNLLLIRYQAYLAVCDKYEREIAAIKKYLPNWAPTFNY